MISDSFHATAPAILQRFAERLFNGRLIRFRVALFAAIVFPRVSRTESTPFSLSPPEGREEEGVKRRRRRRKKKKVSEESGVSRARA